MSDPQPAQPAEEPSTFLSLEGLFTQTPETPAGRREPLKCGLCGRFTRHLTLVWTGGPEPEPDYEVGDCCRKV